MSSSPSIHTRARCGRNIARAYSPPRTGLAASGFGLQALIRDEDVETLRQVRREDVPGQPLVWQVAVRNLVAGLARR